MRYELWLAPGAVTDLRGLRASERAAVRDAIEEHLRFEPQKTSKSRIKRLRGMKKPQYRLRVGTMRVYYDVRDDRVEVLAVVEKPGSAAWLDEMGEKE